MRASPGIKICVDGSFCRFLVPRCGRFCRSCIFGVHLKSILGASFDGCLTLLHRQHQWESDPSHHNICVKKNLWTIEGDSHCLLPHVVGEKKKLLSVEEKQWFVDVLRLIGLWRTHWEDWVMGAGQC